MHSAVLVFDDESASSRDEREEVSVRLCSSHAVNRLAMPSKGVYSIFQQRQKQQPAPQPPPSDAAAPPPPDTSTSTSTAPTPLGPTQPPQQPSDKPLNPAKLNTHLAPPASASSRATTPTDSIILSDDNDSDASPAPVGSSSEGGVKRKTRAAAKGAAKKAKRAVAVREDENDDELIVVEAGKGKGSKGKSKLKGPETPKKSKKKKTAGDPSKKKDLPDTLDLTLSPVRSPSRPSGFASLSETYKRERERRKANEGAEVRWPTREEHGDWVVRREEPTEAQVWATEWRERTAHDTKGKGRELEEDPEEDFLASYHRRVDASDPSTAPRPSGSRPTLETRSLADVPSLLPPLPDHPLLERLAAPLAAPASAPPTTFSRPGDADFPPQDRLWTVKYAPKTADEVLGVVSRASAMHLREWLEELKVSAEDDKKQDKRRRTVNRGVTKPKKKKKKPAELDDFLASSDEDEDGAPSSLVYRSDLDPDASSSSSDDELRSSNTASARRPSTVFPTLTNLLLLTGPHGSGKTSTVHAVARELGYEVFEVYPGMGKRRAVDLERYVGDVGKNHIVSAASPRKGKGSLASLFARQAKGKGKGKGKGKEVEQEEGEKREVGTAGPTQSLILVDEVDVLYTMEHDFWQGITALAKESRRPIIMTCADPSRIPLRDLGIQQIHLLPSLPPTDSLHFSAPDADLAVPYLALVALREGHVVPPEMLSQLYDASTALPQPAWVAQTQPGERAVPHPGGEGTVVGQDLRRALMAMQAELQWGAGASEAAKVGAKDGETRWSVGGLRVPVRRGEEDESEELVAVLTGVSSLSGGEKALDPASEALRQAVRASEALSASDALIDKRIRIRLEDDDSGRFATAGDLELTAPIQTPLPPLASHDDERQMLPFCGAEPAMAAAIRQLATWTWKDALRFGEDEDEALEAARADFALRLSLMTFSPDADRALVHPLWAPALPHPVSLTLYRPFLRSMTLADDAHERAWNAAMNGGAGGVGGGGNVSAGEDGIGVGGIAARVRRSTRAKVREYERALPWQSKEEAQWLRESGFGDSEDEGGDAMDTSVEESVGEA
ncbi:hypothetical protein JCM10207_005659 [Rhodosporidiobolus poonsookiae]